MPLAIRVLGSGTSSGVPTIGCSCDVCHSADPRDTRLRPSILIAHGGRNILIDTTQVATDTIDYVSTDTWGNTATSTRIVVIEASPNL